MIAICKARVQAALATANVAAIYAKEEDASRHKGAEYALVTADDRVGMIRDGAKIGKVDDLAALTRTYHYREYATTADIRVRIVAKDDTTAFGLLGAFLVALGTRFDDGSDYAIEVEAGEASAITDTSILKTGAGYEVLLTFSGGIYSTKQVKLIGTIEPEGEIVKEV